MSRCAAGSTTYTHDSSIAEQDGIYHVFSSGGAPDGELPIRRYQDLALASRWAVSVNLFRRPALQIEALKNSIRRRKNERHCNGT